MFARIICLVAITAMTGSASASVLVGSTFDGKLYNINVGTGLAGNPRPTGIADLVGIASDGSGYLYGLTTFSDNGLYRINPWTGASTRVGSTGLTSIYEGDLAFDPTTGLLYGVWNNTNSSQPRSLFRINKTTAQATLIGTMGTSGDMSAMAFDAQGNLFVLDEIQGLLQVNKNTGAILAVKPLSVQLGNTSGMDFNRATGVLYVVDGDGGGSNKLYTCNTLTGALTLVGSTGVAGGFAGLQFVVPEPASCALLAAGGLSVWAGAGRRTRRR